mmetsp:Transcript_42227/g.67893  ORF Transcript_42227/g.67893 Transcript_42227/m.67893 type:complete len:203 (+) Transcript_42227:224-832(+)|eukprot:CAMPEP_0179430026 /NCGR_PEP_ID=MMETSP0799-20121207/15266_1 /TAXON_ID=46947 /ORGANISM="Geminigera cryophila, Strain CCMP2564" /LENGTH=202 /DNA_ID=CAMNT_0021206245 /DNA_START=215 /DNA_END=823 /DNA_ORIENTATION=+
MVLQLALRGRQAKVAALLAAVVAASLLQVLLAQTAEVKPYSPPCANKNLCNRPRTCFVCTNAEYQVASNGYGGYPVEAQCSAVVENCLYCWKQVETVTLANGWESAYQFKSCVPWAIADYCTGDEKKCAGQYALYSVDYCQTQVQEKTIEACADGGWCTKKTTECACSTELCNIAGRVGVHNVLTSVLLSSFFVLLLRKCVA